MDKEYEKSTSAPAPRVNTETCIHQVDKKWMNTNRGLNITALAQPAVRDLRQATRFDAGAVRPERRTLVGTLSDGPLIDTHVGKWRLSSPRRRRLLPSVLSQRLAPR
jgi:hypothetical protein